MTTRRVRTFVALSLLCTFAIPVYSAHAAQDPQAGDLAFPQNVDVDATLRPLVSMLLRKSATFRRQCARIARAPSTRIVVLAIPPLRESSAARARATVQRFAYGAVRVVIEIPVAADYIELLPHEFEHVIEQIDGVDLGALARRGDDGVMEVDPGVFETARARAAGLAVVAEVFGHTDPFVTGASRQFVRALRVLSERAVGSNGLRTALPGR